MYRFPLLWLCCLILLIGATGGAVLRHRRDAADMVLNQRLVVAVFANDLPAAGAALEDGADPNARMDDARFVVAWRENYEEEFVNRTSSSLTGRSEPVLCL